jgi:D-alanyl-D-alanine carboxypeptidase
MDSLFALIENYKKGMGSISIIYDGREIYQQSIGFADMENLQKADKNTVYRIGSISKTFTDTIIMQLVDEKNLS